MKPLNLFIAVLLICVSATVYAQTGDSIRFHLPDEEIKDVGITFGVHQFSNTFIELGISQTRQSGMGCVWGSYFYGSSLSAEYNPFQNRGGITLTAWTALLNAFTLGANINSYTDFNHYNLGLKPFIGIGGKLSLTYGYNFQIVDNNVPDLNKHCISLRYHLSIKERK